jgi:hypothetical protein
MASELGWWKLETTAELSDGDREHIADSIRDGFTEGQIVPSPDESGYTEIGQLTVTDTTSLDIDDRAAPAWCRRFARALPDGDYAVLVLAFYLGELSRAQPDIMHVLRRTEYLVCSDQTDAEQTTGWRHTRTDIVPVPHTPDRDQARHLCVLLDPTSLTWDGKPFLYEAPHEQPC